MKRARLAACVEVIETAAAAGINPHNFRSGASLSPGALRCSVRRAKELHDQLSRTRKQSQREWELALTIADTRRRADA